MTDERMQLYHLKEFLRRMLPRWSSNLIILADALTFFKTDNIFVFALFEALSTLQNDQLLKFADLMVEKPDFQ